MALDFPNTPANGSIFAGGLGSWTWDGTKWITTPAQVLAISVSPSPPTSPVQGTLWWDDIGGQLYISYNDGNSVQWVIANSFPGAAAYIPIAGGTATGNIGIGVTPPSDASVGTIFPTMPIVFPANATSILATNAYMTGGNWKLISAGGAAAINLDISGYQSAPEFAFYVAPSGAAGSVPTFTEVARIDSGGTYYALGPYAGLAFTDRNTPTYHYTWVSSGGLAQLIRSDVGTNALTIDGSGNATHAGAVVVNGPLTANQQVIGTDAVAANFSAPATSDIFIRINGARIWGIGQKASGFAAPGEFLIADYSVPATRLTIDQNGVCYIYGQVHTSAGYYVNNVNVTPGQIQAASGQPGNVPAHAANCMQGLGYTFTPYSSSRVLAVITGSVVYDANNTTGSAQLRFGTGTPPAHGAASTGTQINFMQVTTTTNIEQVPCTLIAIATGLTIGTTYWFDVYLSTGSTTGDYFSTCYSFLEV